MSEVANLSPLKVNGWVADGTTPKVISLGSYSARPTPHHSSRLHVRVQPLWPWKLHFNEGELLSSRALCRHGDRTTNQGFRT